jgi:hypothetical protein
MINDIRNPVTSRKHTQRRNLARNHGEFQEKILDMVKQNVEDALEKFQDTQNKEYEKTQKQSKEHRGALNKHQSAKVKQRIV